MRGCPVCKRPMTPLFTSYVCDWCDGLREPVVVANGWVVWREAEELDDADEIVLGDSHGRDLYVFPTEEMAERYRRATGAEGRVLEVLSETPIVWRSGRGSIRNLELADRLYTIYPDHRFEPGPYRAFLSPRARKAA